MFCAEESSEFESAAGELVFDESVVDELLSGLEELVDELCSSAGVG